MNTLNSLLILFIMSQTTIDGEVRGTLWRTDNVSGEVELFHPWGRTAVTPVKDAWVIIDKNRISIGAGGEPIIDGRRRQDYMMEAMDGVFDESSNIQLINKTDIVGVGDGEEIYISNTAMVVMIDGKPKFMVFTKLEYADFDIDRVIRELRKYNMDSMIEYLQGFDKGFRQRTFRAVFK